MMWHFGNNTRYLLFVNSGLPVASCLVMHDVTICQAYF